MPAALSKKMKKQARGREPVFCCIGSVLRSFKCLLQIGDDIIGAFQTDRQTDQAIREARDHVAVAVEILGRAVHDDIRAQLQRLHQQRRGKGVVHDDEAVRILRMRVVRDGAKRLYQQIYAQLRALIFSGEIAAGSRCRRIS